MLPCGQSFSPPLLLAQKLWGFPRDLASLLSWWVSLGRLALARLLHRSPRPRACLSCPVVSPSPAPLHKLVRFRGPKPKDSSPSSWPQERPCAAAARKGHSHRIVASGGGEHVPERSRPPGHPGCASPSPAPSVFEHSHSARDHPGPAQPALALAGDHSNQAASSLAGNVCSACCAGCALGFLGFLGFLALPVWAPNWLGRECMTRTKEKQTLERRQRQFICEGGGPSKISEGIPSQPVSWLVTFGWI